MNRTTHGCTTGIPIAQPSTLRSIATAHHCGPNSVAFYAGQTQSISLGSMVHTNRNNSDISRLYPSAIWAPYVYFGNWDAETVAPIKGLQSWPVQSSNICYSGAMSGTVCGNYTEGVVHGMTFNVPGQGLITYDNLVITRQADHYAAAGQGDSGGPALIVNNGELLASGVISAIQQHGGSWDNCLGLDGGRACSRLVLYSPMSNFLLPNPDWGVMYIP